MHTVPNHIITYPYRDHLILFEPVSHRLLILNSSARFIWEHLFLISNIHELARKMTEEFPINTTQALQDIRQCITNWQEAGLFLPANQIQPLRAQRNPYTTCPIPLAEIKRQGPFLFKGSFNLAGSILKAFCTSHKLLQLLQTIMPHLVTAEAREDTPHLTAHLWHEEGNPHIAMNGMRLALQCSIDAQLDWLIAELVDTTYRTRECLAVLHAGAVASGESAILFAGSSGSGKTTLLAALQHRGYTFLADDVCPISQAQAELIPIPMSQNIKQGSVDILTSIYPQLRAAQTIQRKDQATRYMPPLKNTPHAWNHTWQVSTLIFPHYVPATQPALIPVEPLTALSLLIQSGSLCGESFPRFLQWLSSLSAYSLNYASLDEASSLIEQIIFP